ncbi:MAG: M20/M25/M40 family metallo-hydrolase [Actinobacteria bacterium]|nr:M20/M25/M40 family metallo-hydrolase [Actinomycetota bacterium]
MKMRQDEDMISDVVAITQELIQIDTSNYGDSPETVGEAEAADYCAQRLREAGWDPEIIVTSSDHRRAVALRIPGTDPSASGLLVHGHLDVVPAVADEWTKPAFGGVIDDGFIWGRGAVDMKDMDAMILSVVRDWGRTGYRPRRDIVILLLPDEEAGSVHGSHWLAEHRPDLFAGVTQAIGEVGGFSITIKDDLRLYPIQTAEKGMKWLRLRAAARAGHGSMIHEDNSVTQLARAVTRIGEHQWPIHKTSTVQRFLDELSQAFGIDVSDVESQELHRRLGNLSYLVGATMQNTANPTVLRAGYKTNVIPTLATAEIDCRFLPGQEEELDATIRLLVGDGIDVDVINYGIAVEAPLDTQLFEIMASALRAEDEKARAVPYMISGGTDAKAFAGLEIECYGFSPLQMPAGLDYWRLFHGVDECVPIEGLEFGVRVLDRFLRAC